MCTTWTRLTQTIIFHLGIHISTICKWSKMEKNIKSNDHITLYFATNSTSTYNIPLAMISNSKNPRCLGRDNRKAKIIYLKTEENMDSWIKVKVLTSMVLSLCFRKSYALRNDDANQNRYDIPDYCQFIFKSIFFPSLSEFF